MFMSNCLSGIVISMSYQLRSVSCEQRKQDSPIILEVDTWFPLPYTIFRLRISEDDVSALYEMEIVS